MSSRLPAVADRSGGALLSPSASLASPKTATLHSTGILAGQPWTACRVRNLNLRAHCRVMGRARAAQSALCCAAAFRLFARLCEILESRSRILTELHPNVLPAVPALFRMAACHARVIRDPETWVPDTASPPEAQWASLVRHLFEKWPVSPVFAKAWFTIGPVRHIERDWFCHLAAGGSLRRLPGMPSLTASAAREVASAPLDLSASEALRWAQLKALNCPENLATAVLRSRMAGDFANDGIWLPLLEKFIAAPHVDPAEFGIVADGFRYLICESGTKRARELLRQPLRDLVRHWRKRWWQFLEYALPPGLEPAEVDVRSARLRARVVSSLLSTWPAMSRVTPYASSFGFHCRKNQQWTINELCAQRLLLEEGTLMRHCVVLYASGCRRGYFAIFRMRLCTAGDETETEFSKSTSWTIRVEPIPRLIVEIKGYRNRLPDLTELRVIKAWASRNRLRFASQFK
jgi:hypothetical protein